MPVRVMVGSAGAISAPEVVWSLASAGFEVYAYAPPGSRPALRHSRSVTLVEVDDPRASARRAVDTLSAAIRSAGCEVFLPLDDAALWLCGPLRARNPDLLVPVGDAQVQIALDKWRQLEAARRAGLQTPATALVRSASEALAIADFPAFVKGSLAMTQTGDRLTRDPCFAVHDDADMRRVAERWDFTHPMLVQPRLDGVGTGIFGFATPAGVRNWSAHRRIRMMSPLGSGSSACEAIAPEPELCRGVERMIAEIGWRGMFMVELLRDASGRAWFMELNGRAWGSMALARRAGLEYPAWTARSLVDERFVPEHIDGAIGIRCRHLGRELNHLLLVLRGPKSAHADRWPSRWRTILDLLGSDGRSHWYNWHPDEPRVFWQDAWDTVWGALRRKGQ
jgi:hypothetical protein